MKSLSIPTSELEWRRTASAIIRANLKLAHMKNTDLAAALSRIGVNETPKAISAKLMRGSFSASFLLQCLVATGTEQIELPSETRIR